MAAPPPTGTFMTARASKSVQYTFVASTAMSVGWSSPDARVVGAPPATGAFITTAAPAPATSFPAIQ